jgi:hypothetical protein
VLEAEKIGTLPLFETMQASLSRLPWSLLQVFAFVRVRRAYNTARVTASPEGSGPSARYRGEYT